MDEPWLDELEEDMQNRMNEIKSNRIKIDNMQDQIKYENDEELYNYLKTEFEQTKIKDCVNLDDHNHIEEFKSYIENGFVNDKLDEHVEYKILLMGLPDENLIGHTTALYIPRHINVLYIDGMYKIELYKSELDIETLLEESKIMPGEKKTFHEKYKKIVLMKPYIPEYTRILFDNYSIFYYETIIRDIEIYMEENMYDSYMNKEHNQNLYKSMADKGHLTFWVNYVDDYIKLVDLSGDGYYERKLIPREENLHKFNKNDYRRNINKYSFEKIVNNKDKRFKGKNQKTLDETLYNTIFNLVLQNQKMILLMYSKCEINEIIKNNNDLDHYKQTCVVENIQSDN